MQVLGLKEWRFPLHAEVPLQVPPVVETSPRKAVVVVTTEQPACLIEVHSHVIYLYSDRRQEVGVFYTQSHFIAEVTLYWHILFYPTGGGKPHGLYLRTWWLEWLEGHVEQELSVFLHWLDSLTGPDI